MKAGPYIHVCRGECNLVRGSAGRLLDVRAASNSMRSAGDLLRKLDKLGKTAGHSPVSAFQQDEEGCRDVNLIDRIGYVILHMINDPRRMADSYYNFEKILRLR